MQGIQNIPSPDVEPNDVEDNFNDHSQIEQDLDNDENGNAEIPQDINQDRQPTPDTEQIPKPENEIEESEVQQASMTF